MPQNSSRNSTQYKSPAVTRRQRALERIDDEIFQVRCFLASRLTEKRRELSRSRSSRESKRLSAEILEIEGAVDRIAEMTTDERRLSYAWRVLGARL